MTLHFAGDSIECMECEVTTRKVVPSGIQQHEDLGMLVKYDFSRNCKAKNLEELVPKEYKYKITSNLDLGTALNADSIYILTKSLKPLNLDVVNESSRHKANKGCIKSFTFAEIKYPLQNVINSIAKRKALKE